MSTSPHGVRRRDEAGASAVEYGLLVAGIALAIAAAVLSLGPMLAETTEETCQGIMARQDPGGASCTAP